MKRLLLPLLALLIPAAHATNYVECEAIRTVIMRNGIQKDEALKSVDFRFKKLKVKEKYYVDNCLDFDYDSWEREQCDAFASKVFSTFKDEYVEYVKPTISPYLDIEQRATNDFKKRGCYYF